MRIFLVLALILVGLGIICAVATTTILGAGALVWFMASVAAYYVNQLTNEYRIGPPIG